MFPEIISWFSGVENKGDHQQSVWLDTYELCAYIACL